MVSLQPAGSAHDTGHELIRFENVSKSFELSDRTVRAVENVNLSVAKGEFVVLVGPSGCGKSTLLNMAAGLFHPTNGEVYYAGKRVDGYNLKTGYMTQNDHLLPWRDVVGNISTPLEIRGLAKGAREARVEQLIDLVGLQGFERSYPSQLSGGMRKRTALARLLAYDPETLLLDEPFAALDAQLRLNMQIELLRISRSLNKTILFVTHDLDEAVALSDRSVVFSPRPGHIRHIADTPLPRDRNLTALRHDPLYTKMTAELWDLIMPTLNETRGEAS
ncbi:ABC transporter ATP-binding protein [Nitratireductor soli]|uniref:ABC transporter ATP-binding protein n=1 Tax=Nitratireductor soli TaxID=1670619 RepID=UPI00065DDD95|nr:ABC transporter ATP-binding protein [Nitratireductor soli]